MAPKTTLLGTVLLIIVCCSRALSAEEASTVLGVQRAKLLEQAPFRIEFKISGHFDSTAGKRDLPSKVGYAVFTKDGRFLIVEKSIGNKGDAEPSLFAWDGKKLYRSMESNSTYFINQSEFKHYIERDEDSSLLARVPVIDMFEALGAKSEGKKPLSPTGINLRVDGLDAFGCLAIHDMYYTETAGKFGPRWVDVVDNSLFAKSITLADPPILTSDKETVVVFRSGQNRLTKRGASYFHQAFLGKQGEANANKVVKYISRGPWTSIAQQTDPIITPSYLDSLLLSTGTICSFEYKNEIADGWMPSAVSDLWFDRRVSALEKAVLVDPTKIQSLDSFPNGVLCRTRLWEVTQFDKLTDADCSAIFDQFVISQKNMVNLTQMPGWKARYSTTPSPGK